jgi:hypothetical protein
MARKDEILKSFISHPLIKEKYSREATLPATIREALVSEEPIIKAIALIIENTETSSPQSDLALYRTVTQYLNTASI